MKSLYLITPPTDDVVTLAEAKAQLRVTSTTDDVLISALILASVNQLDPAGGGWLGRALRPQTWEIRSSNFGEYDPSVSYYKDMREYYGSGYYRNFRYQSVQELPYPPLISITSVKYDDSNGVEQTLIANTDYRVFGGTGKVDGFSVLAPARNKVWPSSIQADDEAVRIRFMCGYERGSATDPLPAPIKQAVILMIKQLYEFSKRDMALSSLTIEGISSRSYVLSENTTKALKVVTEGLLGPYRIYE